MASRRHQRRRECEEKRQHADEGAAIREAGRLRMVGLGTLRAYKCSFGGHWHVGHTVMGRRLATAVGRA